MGRVILYPSYGDLSAVPSVEYSTLYEVRVDGKPIEILCLEDNITAGGQKRSSFTDVKHAHFGMFAFADTEVSIEVRFNRPITGAVVRPMSYGIRPVIREDRLTFTLTEPDKYLSVEINGWTEPLFLFCEQPETDVPSPDDETVTWFGPGVHTLNEDIEKPFQPENGHTLYLAPGAFVNGSLDVSYRKHVKILGRGILNGSIWKKNAFRCALAAYGAEDLLVDGPTFMGHPAGTTGTHGEDYVFRRFKVVAFGENTDGINMTKNIQVSDVFLFCNDDRLRLQDGCNGARIQRCVVWNIRNGNTFVEDRGMLPTKDIEYRDIDIIHNEIPFDGAADERFSGNINFKYLEAPCAISNLRFYNVRMEQNNGYAIEIDLNNRYPWYRLDPPYEQGIVRDLLFSNITCAPGMTTVFKGLDEKYGIEGVYLNGVSVNGAPAHNLDEANASVNDFARGIHFNRGMLALKEPDYNGIYDTGDVLTLEAGAYDFPQPPERVTFLVDGKPVGDSAEPFRLDWTAVRGEHRLQALTVVNGEEYRSCEMTVYVGDNLLANPDFEDEDISMWVHAEGKPLDRRGDGEPTHPKSGRYYLHAPQREHTYEAVRQGVTAALRERGPGRYAIEGAATAYYAWTGLHVGLRIRDEAGEHTYKSNGTSYFSYWGPTCNYKILDVTWTGELKEAVFYLSTTDETSSGQMHPNPSVMWDTYIDDCHLNYLG